MTHLSLNKIGDSFIHTYKSVSGKEIDLAVQQACVEEEMHEYIEECNFGVFDSHNELKEMGDVIFTLATKARLLGYDLDKAISLIAANNQSKFDNATFREDGKLLKGPNYTKVDLSSCIDYGDDIEYLRPGDFELDLKV